MLARFADLAPPGLASDPLPLAYASDLWALIDLAGRRARHDVVQRADALLRAIAGCGDLCASTP